MDKKRAARVPLPCPKLRLTRAGVSGHSPPAFAMFSFSRSQYMVALLMWQSMLRPFCSRDARQVQGEADGRAWGGSRQWIAR